MAATPPDDNRRLQAEGRKRLMKHDEAIKKLRENASPV